MGFIGINPGPETLGSRDLGGGGGSSGGGSSLTSETCRCDHMSSSSSLTEGLASEGKILNSASPAGAAQHIIPHSRSSHCSHAWSGDAPPRIQSSVTGTTMTSSMSAMTLSSSCCRSAADATTKQQNHQQLLASSVAHFLLTRKGLSKQRIGQYLGNLQSPFNQLVLDHFLLGIDLSGLSVDEALRKVRSHVQTNALLSLSHAFTSCGFPLLLFPSHLKASRSHRSCFSFFSLSLTLLRLLSRSCRSDSMRLVD